MFKIGLIIGIYSYIIFACGLLGILNYTSVLAVSILYFFTCFILLKGRHYKSLNLKTSSKERAVIAVLILLAGINLIGALGPELAFDALWYHLTVPKEFILNQKVSYIPGNLLYYSAMPQLTEMLYIPALLFGNEITAKLLHYSFGILTCIVIYKFSRLYLNRFYSLLAALIFYSNLVIAWLSITAYADLSRAFFEILALYLFARFASTTNITFFIQSAIIVGFAVGAKILSLLSILYYLLVIVILYKDALQRVVKSFQFVGITILVSSPWFIFALISTGNPIFPIFSQYYTPSASLDLLNPIQIVISFITIFLFSQDPISPIYLILLPLLILNIKAISSRYRILFLYVISTLLLWYVTPQTGGGRFMAAYLPAYSILASILLAKYSKVLRKPFIYVVIAIAFTTVVYRGSANVKFLPVLSHSISKEHFLLQNLNFEFGDFYDERNDIEKRTGQDTVLLIGLHNLYYVNFPHDHISWSEGGEYEYILVQKETLDKYMFPNYLPVYQNARTNVTLYQLNDKESN